MARLSVGDRFPELSVESVDGPVELRERWEGGPLVVALMRHFGWPFCRAHLVQLDRARDDIAAAGGDVVCVFMYRAGPTRNFCRQRKVELDCYGDPDRALYQAVGLERGGRKELYPAKLGLATIRAARAGAVVGDAQGGDVRQMPGTFVVDADGRVAYAHYHRDQTDNPPVKRMLEAVRSAAAWRRPVDNLAGVVPDLSPKNQIEITVDRGLCIGSGDCVDTAPDVFQLDDEDKAVVVDPDGAPLEDVLTAAGNCPVSAIFVVGEEGDLYP